jgi:hypothetical protein
MRSLKLLLILAALVWVPTAFDVWNAAGQGSDRQRLVGTYRHVVSERKDASGKWTPEPGSPRMGYITYSDTGYMGVHLMPQGRTPFADPTQPTPEEAQKAINGYTAYFGPYVVDEKQHFAIHQRAGQITPTGGDYKRYFDFVGNRLILTPADNGITKEQAMRHIIWERLPNAQLSAEAKRFVGVRKLLYTDRYVEKDGKLIKHGERNEARTGSYIIYTPTGHMMVHLMDKAGRVKWAGSTPTPPEALATYKSYGGYFGHFTVFENAKPKYVVHNQEGTLNPGRQSDQQRFYELNGNILRLGGPPTVTNGEASGGHLYWELLLLLSPNSCFSRVCDKIPTSRPSADLMRRADRV